MSSTLDRNIKLSLFGESHGEEIGITIDNLAPGIKIDLERINSFLAKRRPDGITGTSRIELDDYRIISGYFNGFTTGAPLTIVVANSDRHSNDYTPNLLRPGHADYTAHLKYLGFQDYRGGGHFSGRMTTPIVIAGAIFTQILENKGIKIATHIKEIADVVDCDFDYQKLDSQIDDLNKLNFAVLNKDIEDKMKEKIIAAKADMDSVGGILETIVTNVEGGIGEPFFDSIESVISSLMFSIPAVKGVEFGKGFAFAKMRGSDANDTLHIENSKVEFKSNNNGGINGGITNGMPIQFKVAIKPTPSIAKTQASIDYETKTNIELNLKGRHDPCIVQRARIVVDSLTAYAILDFYSKRYGYMWMVK